MVSLPKQEQVWPRFGVNGFPWRFAKDFHRERFCRLRRIATSVIGSRTIARPYVRCPRWAALVMGDPMYKFAGIKMYEVKQSWSCSWSIGLGRKEQEQCYLAERWQENSPVEGECGARMYNICLWIIPVWEVYMSVAHLCAAKRCAHMLPPKCREPRTARALSGHHNGVLPTSMLRLGSFFSGYSVSYTCIDMCRNKLGLHQLWVGLLYSWNVQLFGVITCH